MHDCTSTFSVRAEVARDDTHSLYSRVVVVLCFVSFLLCCFVLVFFCSYRPRLLNTKVLGVDKKGVSVEAKEVWSQGVTQRINEEVLHHNTANELVALP